MRVFSPNSQMPKIVMAIVVRRKLKALLSRVGYSPAPNPYTHNGIPTVNMETQCKARQTRNKDFSIGTVQYRHQTWVAIKIDRTLVEPINKGVGLQQKK